MWYLECKGKSAFSAHVVDTPPGQNAFVLWYVYGLAANQILGSVAVDLDEQVARVRKPLEDGEVIEIVLLEEKEYPTRLFPNLVLVNRA